MTLRQAIVLGDGGELHVTLQAGDTLDPSSLTVSTDPASLLLNNSVDGLGAYLTTKDSTSFKFAGAGSVTSPLTLTPIISPAAGNQLDVLPSGLFAGGLMDAPVTEFIDKPSGTDITPAYNKKYAANNIYLVGVDQGDYTLDVSNLTISALGLSPGYKIRLTAWSRGNSTVTLKGTSWTPSGSNTRGQVIQLNSRITCWEITITAGTSPHVIQAWPMSTAGISSVQHSDSTTVTTTGDGTTNSPLSSALRVSAVAGNGIRTLTDGVFSGAILQTTESTTTLKYSDGVFQRISLGLSNIDWLDTANVGVLVTVACNFVDTTATQALLYFNGVDVSFGSAQPEGGYTVLATPRISESNTFVTAPSTTGPLVKVSASRLSAANIALNYSYNPNSDHRVDVMVRVSTIVFAL